MQKALVALGVAAGMVAAQAAVLKLTALNPVGFLSTAAGQGLGPVAWQPGGLQVDVGAVVGVPLQDGWVVDTASDTILYQLNSALLSHSGSFSVPGQIQLSTLYYLVVGTGGSVGGTGGSVTSVYTSDSFQLVPEPGTYALLAGLGLVAFAGYRRLRG